MFFTTPPFSSPIVLFGSFKFHLNVKSDRVDTDFYVRITDVLPTGESVHLQDGIMRSIYLE